MRELWWDFLCRTLKLKTWWGRNVVKLGSSAGRALAYIGSVPSPTLHFFLSSYIHINLTDINEVCQHTIWSITLVLNILKKNFNISQSHNIFTGNPELKQFYLQVKSLFSRNVMEYYMVHWGTPIFHSIWTVRARLSRTTTLSFIQFILVTIIDPGSWYIYRDELRLWRHRR